MSRATGVPGVVVTLLRLVGWATIVAGIVGVVRQRAEAQRVRRGELPPAARIVDDAPQHPYGALSQRLATWVPERPRTPAGRLLGFVWAAPLTLVGAGVALASGRVPRWDPALGCLVARDVGGPSGVALRSVGAQANAIGHVVLAGAAVPPAGLLAHEAVHVRQAERLGPLLVLAYLWLGARHGYRDHPLERAARLGARRAVRGSWNTIPIRRSCGATWTL
ncbi:MAG: hypothetical protein EA387_03615, partial [Nitriliruptor sp.]